MAAPLDTPPPRWGAHSAPTPQTPSCFTRPLRGLADSSSHMYLAPPPLTRTTRYGPVICLSYHRFVLYEYVIITVATSRQRRTNLRILQSQLGKNHFKPSTMVGEHFEITCLKWVQTTIIGQNIEMTYLK